MRFLKITDTSVPPVQMPKDVLHIWIEDDCPDWLIDKILNAMMKVENEFEPGRYYMTDRKFKLVKDSE